MVICAVIGKFLRLVYKPLAAIIFLIFMMYFTANMGWQVGWIGAFHPVAGVLLIFTATVALVKGYKIGLQTDEGKKEFKKEKNKKRGLFSLIFIGAGSGLIIGFILSNILALLGLLLFEQPIGIKFLPFYKALLSSILVPVIMQRKTKSNLQSTESNVFEKGKREKRMKEKSYKILSMLLLPFMLSLAGCSVEPTASEGSLKFTQPLKIPPLLEPTVKNDGTKHFTLTMQKGETEFLPGKMTDTFGINGSYLGPTIRVSREDRVSFDVVNQLGETSTLHWHGMLLASIDGWRSPSNDTSW